MGTQSVGRDLFSGSQESFYQISVHLASFAVLAHKRAQAVPLWFEAYASRSPRRGLPTNILHLRFEITAQYHSLLLKYFCYCDTILRRYIQHSGSQNNRKGIHHCEHEKIRIPVFTYDKASGGDTALPAAFCCGLSDFCFCAVRRQGQNGARRLVLIPI